MSDGISQSLNIVCALWVTTNFAFILFLMELHLIFIESYGTDFFKEIYLVK